MVEELNRSEAFGLKRTTHTLAMIRLHVLRTKGLRT